MQEKFKALFGNDCLNQCILGGIETLYVHPSSILRILTLLRDHHLFLCEQLIDIVVVDYPSKPKRFELTYHLLSLTHKKRIFVKIELDDGEMIPTATHVFINANWYEREIWDLMGIPFKDHPDLRRILTDYNFIGHPLRKDFPLTGYTQVTFNKESHKVESEPVNLQQNYRDFNFTSPWNQ